MTRYKPFIKVDITKKIWGIIALVAAWIQETILIKLGVHYEQLPQKSMHKFFSNLVYGV